jgi:ATP-dependent DNA ligase
MLSRPGASALQPRVKWDGFRAVVSTESGLRVRSRRGCDMTPLLPGLHELPVGVVLDGELVAWDDGARHAALVWNP